MPVPLPPMIRRALPALAVAAVTLAITAAPARAAAPAPLSPIAVAATGAAGLAEAGDVLKTGSGRFLTVGNGTGVIGDEGELRRYCVRVEEDITEVEAEEFAGEVDRTLANPRSWTASGQWRLQRVPDCADAFFRIHLATPDTVDAMCGSAGLDTAGEVSCDYRHHVVINLRRWVFGVPHFDGDLAAYRGMVVNHEVGHDLGHGHEFCSGPGRLAPVMQQQTYGLQGCEANPYPYPYGLDGLWRGWRLGPR